MMAGERFRGDGVVGLGARRGDLESLATHHPFFCFAEEGEGQADEERTAAGRNTRVRKAGGCTGLL